MQIKEVRAAKIKDSRGEFTIEVSVNKSKASSPSGTSTGKYETPSYHKSLDWDIKAINNFKELKNIEINSFEDLEKVESLIKNKFKFKQAKEFGANSLFALESAILKALAVSKEEQLWEIINPNAYKFPIPVGNAVGGGLHADNKNHPVFQEFLLIPKENSFISNVNSMEEIYRALGLILNAKEKDQEGAWETTLHDEQILSIFDKFKHKIHIGLDIAASTIFKDHRYHYGKVLFSREKQIKYINHLIDRYHIFYIEDPLQEEDFLGFQKINQSHLIVGDDLTVTNLERVKKALKEKAITALIIKPNQNGSLLELKNILDFCKSNHIATVISHRAGETFDDALADFAFGFGADYIKCGISTLYREVKLQRLMDIEKSLEHHLLRRGKAILSD